jgi:hypothetical protein
MAESITSYDGSPRAATRSLKRVLAHGGRSDRELPALQESA